MIGDVEVRCYLVGRQVRRRSGDERDRCPAEVEEDAVHRIDEHADDLLVVQRVIFLLLIGVAKPAGQLERGQIGRAHVCTPVTNAHLVCRLLLEKKNTNAASIYEDNITCSRDGYY